MSWRSFLAAAGPRLWKSASPSVTADSKPWAVLMSTEDTSLCLSRYLVTTAFPVIEISSLIYLLTYLLPYYLLLSIC